jgi:hypothetical protein
MVLLWTCIDCSDALAQPRCTVRDTPRECVLRWIPSAVSAPAPDPAPAAEAVRATVASFSSGLSSVDAPIRTALKDFLSVASGSLESATLGDSGTSLTFGYNLPVAILGAARPLRLESVFDRPQLSAATNQALTDPTAAAALQRSLSSLDDARVSLTLDPATTRFGRNPDPHRELWNALYLTALNKTGPNLEESIQQAVAAAGITPEHAGTRVQDFVAGPIAQQALLTALTAAAASVFPPPPADLTKDFSVLLDNQPQLYGSFRHHHRKNVIGPPEWATRVTWEIGHRNLNAFYHAEGRHCVTVSEADSAGCAAAFAAYLQRLATVRRAYRLALALEYRASAKATVFPGVAGTYDIPATRSLVYSATYGRPFGALITGKESWVDLTVEYNGKTHTSSVGTTGDNLSRLAIEPLAKLSFVPLVPPARPRSAAAVTFTQPITDQLLVPVSIVYTDVVEFIPGRPVNVSPAVPPSVTSKSATRTTVLLGIVYRVLPSRASEGVRCCCQ